MEAFSDGVMAVIITILVLEMKSPHSPELSALREIWPKFIGYVLSFVYVGIYWNNHHHLLHIAERVNGMTLWANLHLLFWLSLIPFVTGWMGETHFATWPVVAYGLVLLMCAIAWEVQRRVLLQAHPGDCPLRRAITRNSKELISLGIYLIALGVAFFNTTVACVLYAVVAAIWFIPDKRIERELHHS